ncbi:MAG TPA: single-stranded DNA-binding protein [Saprospiraceae bacterium]|nr:single-stranded DNA-binding protein [Saprospiraceae bacterium]
MINKVILLGNLGRDPEIRTLESGAKIATFSIATNENYKDKNGEWQQVTEWHNVKAWNKLAERAEQSLKKGTLIYLEGKLTHRKYTDNNNVEKYITEVVPYSVRIINKPDGPGNDSAMNTDRSEDNSYVETTKDSFDNDGNTEDDLPF